MQQLRRFHIEPFVSMIIGFDDDTPETADQIVDFCNKAKIGAFFLYILTPPPGSALYERLQEKGVAIKQGWHLYDGTHSLYNTKHMTSEVLEETYRNIYKRVYSHGSIIRRTMFPPHFFMAFVNWYVFRRDFYVRNHPWLGSYPFYQRYLIGVMTKIATLLTHPLVRRFSAFLRMEWLIKNDSGKK